MTYLPPEYSSPGTHLVVEYLGDQYPVTVEGSGALFDPANERIMS
jgi:glycine cleavage system aminomethyltransferase T